MTGKAVNGCVKPKSVNVVLCILKFAFPVTEIKPKRRAEMLLLKLDSLCCRLFLLAINETKFFSLKGVFIGSIQRGIHWFIFPNFMLKIYE